MVDAPQAPEPDAPTQQKDPSGPCPCASDTPASQGEGVATIGSVGAASPCKDPAPRATNGSVGAEPLQKPPRGLDLAQEIPREPPLAPPPHALSPAYRALFIGIFGFAAVASLLAIVMQIDGSTGPTNPEESPVSTLVAPAQNPTAFAPSSGSPPTASSAPTANATDQPATTPPGPWRVTELASKEGVKVAQGKLGHKSLMDTLMNEHVPQGQAFRILKAFEGIKRFDKPRKDDIFVVALDRSTQRVRGFEYQASTTDIWQAKEGDDGLLRGSKLDLHVEQHRVAKAVLVKDELKSSVVEAGFDDDILDSLDDALEDRVALTSVHRGATLRVIAQEQRVSGQFSRYVNIEAVEYTPPKEKAEPIRIYHFTQDKDDSGYFDEHGRAPYKGGWRTPLKFARITSRFNPKRMHPVLHTIMPHNGCDFGAPVGTPVYAASHGTVDFVGNKGPSGNLILIDHSAGLQTGYAHLSRFAPGLKLGDKVDTRQLIGFVGSTGRSTGPHLHFSLKKDGAFVDPLTLKLNGERVVAKRDRDVFTAFKNEMDTLLNGIPIPQRPSNLDTSDPPAEDEPADDSSEELAPSEAHSEQPAPAASMAPPDPSLNSAIWKPN